MNIRRTGFTLTALAAIALIFSFAQFASAQDDGNNDQDPPARAGRVSNVTGSVSFQPGGQGDWLDAVVNRPLTTGDNLWSDKDARAEVQIGSTSIRLAPETSVTFLALDDSGTQLRLSVGSLYFRVRQLDDGESFEVDTPNLAFNVNRPGQYRIDVNENGDQTIATVWQGEGEITGGGSSYRLSEGQQGTFSGTDQLAYDVGEISRPDDFDQWAMDGDSREDRAHSQYVSDDMTGYEDLNEYGSWHNVDGYGNVWSPAGVPGDWAPYRFGHWVYIAPWGWTWVEDEPWGFAPFHYGRWAFAGGGWCWIPGPVVGRPVYSPALVAFVGGGGFHVGVGVGVGWFPLGPGEVFVPWYRTSPRYVQNVNVTNTHVTVVQVTNVYNNVTVNHVNNVTYVNQRGGHGVTVVDRNTFVNAQPVNRHIVSVNQREIASAQVNHEVVRNIAPVRQSVMGNAHQVRYAPPERVMTRTVVATRAPVVVNRPNEPDFTRRAVPPPVRTVKPAPQVETLNRGARGRTPGAENAPNAGRQPENRPGAPANAERPGAPANAQRPEPNVPRPGNSENPGNSEMRRQPSRNNYPAARPNGGDNNGPNVPNNRPNTPENNQSNNRPNREVPRPPSSRPEQPQAQPERPMNTPEANPRQENPRGQEQRTPESTQPENRPNVQENRPNQPENRPNTSESRPSNPPQNENRPAPPETRHESAPPETRQQPEPRRDSTPEARPQPERSQHESRPSEQRNDKGDKGSSDKGNDGKDKQKFR